MHFITKIFRYYRDEYLKRPMTKKEYPATNSESKKFKLGFDQPVLFGSSYIHVYDPHVQENYFALSRGYDEEARYKELISSIRHQTMVTYDGLISLCDIIRYCEQHNISGGFAEAGVCKGGATALMSLVSKEYGKSPRTIYAFDSFIGLPEPIAEKDFDDGSLLDIEQTFNISKNDSTGKLRAINALCADKQEFLKFMIDQVGHPEDKLKVYEGWFQDTMPAVVDEIPELAVLRLDGDLYDSYKTCLAYLYPKVKSGGFVIIDDWVIRGCRNAVTEYFLDKGGIPFMFTADITTRIFIKP